MRDGRFVFPRSIYSVSDSFPDSIVPTGFPSSGNSPVDSGADGLCEPGLHDPEMADGDGQRFGSGVPASLAPALRKCGFEGPGRTTGAVFGDVAAGART